MKADFSRWSFDATKHYHAVLQQQGRVTLDSDWNEQTAIYAHRVESESLDVIGPAGAPADDAGFQLSVASNNLSVSAGRAYVDGILCQNEQPCLITAQPDIPGFTLPKTAGTYVAYLQVWLRNIIYLDDAAILEEALGGPDTCCRAKTVWQVNLVQASASTGSASSISCATDVSAYGTLSAASTGKLNAQAQPNPNNTDPCMVPAQAGYQSLENQLYRVEVHTAGDISSGKVSFKWSRDNGSVVTSWTGQSGNTLTVSSTGRDAALGFAAGQWVELTDDTHELNFQPGTLAQITSVQGLALTINPATATGPMAIASFPTNPKVRRWDSAGEVTASTGTWLNLEDGVQVEFSVGTYSTGDYWLIPARTLTANIHWPEDSSNHPIPQPPKGIQRHYARLAIVQYDGTNWSVTANCLPIFYPITDNTRTSGIHVVDVRTKEPDAELLNDSDVSLSGFALTIRIICDTAIDPVSAKPATCFVTIGLPFVSVATLDLSALGTQLVVLAGQVGLNPANAAEIDIAVTPISLRLLYDQLSQTPTTRVLARVTVKGGFIWAQNNPQLYLDGEAFGVTRQDPTGNRIGMRIPPQSGNGTPGSDFEMWFWLTRPVALSALSFSPNPVTAGTASTGTVTLNGYAPPGGAVVTLTAGSTAGQLGAKSITIAEGMLVGSFQVTNTAVAAGAVTTALQVTASYGTSTVSGTLTIDQEIAVASTIFNPASVVGGSPSTGTVTLNVAAPASGAVVTLTSSDTAAGTIPASVTIAAGQKSATFQATTIQRGTNLADISLIATATYNNTSAKGTLTITSLKLT